MFSFLRKNRKLILTLALVAGGIFFTINQALAQEAPAQTSFFNGSWTLTAVGHIVKWYVQAIGKLVLLMIGILIKVASYNEFVNSAAVKEGWVIMRDVVNMFFILILLVIAFATIFNVKEYKYQAMLPRLLIMAVVINYSRTIAGIFIDFGQVVMLTFVNGFQAAAGGNFVNALRINDLLTFSPDIAAKDTSLGFVFAAYILAALIITVTLVVVVAMVMILIMRIVMLWFLVVLSPIAFMSSVWPGGRLKANYGKWWEMFIDNITIGPIMAFFLWLSLLVLGSGTIGKEFMGGDVSANLPSAAGTKIGTFENMISYLMGIGMLLGSLYMTKNLQAAGSGIAGSVLGKIQGYASAGLRKAAMLPVRGAKAAGESIYERSGARATVGAVGTIIQGSKIGKFVGLGTKQYKDLEKAKRDEVALRRFGKTTDADALRNRILADEARKISESGMSTTEIGAKLASGKLKKGTYEYEATARAAAGAGILRNSADFKKYAGDDRRMEEALRASAFKAGNKDAYRGWVADPKKGYNKKKEAEDVYYKKSRGERQASYSNIVKSAELDENGKVSGEFAAADLSVIDPEDFGNFSEKIQKGIFNAITLLEKNDAKEFKDFKLYEQFNKLAARVSGENFSAYSSANGKALFDSQAKSVAEKRLNAYRAGTYQPSDISKAAIQTFRNVVGREGAGTGLDQGREWQKNTLERTYEIQNAASVMARSGDMAKIEEDTEKLNARLLAKAKDMDAMGVKTGQIDSSTGLEMKNVDAFMNSDLTKNITSLNELAKTRSVIADDPVDSKTKEAMQNLSNLVARSMETVAPRTMTMSSQDITRKTVGRYGMAKGRAARAFDTAKAVTDLQKRKEAVQLAVKKAKDAASIISSGKKQFSEDILNAINEINMKLDNLSQLGASASDGAINDVIAKLDEIEKKTA